MGQRIIEVNNSKVIALIPEAPVKQALWLIAPDGTGAGDWLSNTGALKYSETAKAVLVCLEGGKEDAFYTEDVWNALMENIDGLSADPKCHRLLGFGSGADKCLRLVLEYPEKYNVVVAVCPEADADRSIVTCAEAYKNGHDKWPRMVICDTADGCGKALGDAINEFGAGMHVHSERPVGGWELMDSEISSCLAHL